MRTKFIHGLSAVLLWLSTASPALAHKASDSYLAIEMTPSMVNGRWDLALRDLETALGLDANDDGEITWAEVRAQHAAIAAYASSRLHLTLDGETSPLVFTNHAIAEHSDGAYASLQFQIAHNDPATLGIQYNALFDIDPQHRGLVKLTTASGARAAIFAPGTARQEFALGESSAAETFATFVWQGVWHIWIGFDHILFLIALLLPAVLRFEKDRWIPVLNMQRALANIAKTVTAFTLAHSITLTLAALEFVQLPSRLVETSIAASVIVAALNNLWPVMHRRAALIAFVFGLIHGFGFANVLSDLGTNGGALAMALLGFNLGVELGQLAIVVVFVPLAYAMRESWGYRTAVLKFGSAAVILIAGIWMFERLLDWKLLPV